MSTQTASSCNSASIMLRKHKAYICGLMVVLIVLLTTQFADANPVFQAFQNKEFKEETSTSSPCRTKPEDEILCQRCAKSTKSTIVFPMCCRDIDKVFEWCKRYLDFGI